MHVRTRPRTHLETWYSSAHHARASRKHAYTYARILYCDSNSRAERRPALSRHALTHMCNVPVVHGASMLQPFAPTDATRETSTRCPRPTGQRTNISANQCTCSVLATALSTELSRKPHPRHARAKACGTLLSTRGPSIALWRAAKARHGAYRRPSPVQTSPFRRLRTSP